MGMYNEVMTTTTDPRGPVRTLATVDPRTDGTLVTFEECDHTGRRNQTMTYRVGDRDRCFECRIVER